jgi:LCP family protein required for cell wall assembly
VRRRASNGGLARNYAIALGLAVVLVVVGIVGVNVLVALKLSSVSKVSLQLSSSSGGANYLLVGSDTRAFVSNPSDRQAFGSQAGNQGQRSDTIMVLHEVDSGHSLLVSIPRDLWVNIPGVGLSKINSAYNNGPQKLVDTIQSVFNVPIDHYVEVNFDTFRKIVDAIGTVPVYFPAPARDSFSDLNIPTPGCWHLNGPQALSFVRSRDLQVQDPTTHQWKVLDQLPDVGRVGRQQAFLRQLSTVALNTILTNPLKANTIADQAISDLRLDNGFSRGDLFNLVGAFRATSPIDPNRVQTMTLPIKTGPTQGGQDVLYLKQPEANAVLAQLRDFSGGSNPSAGAASAPSGARVRVLNASGVRGLAGRTLASLEKDGFIGAGTGNAAGGLTSASEIRYASGNEAAARTLAGYVPSARLVVDRSVTGADVELVLGRSFTGLSTPTTAPAATPSASPSPAPQTPSLAPVPGAC